jgi:hypothetical protein
VQDLIWGEKSPAIVAIALKFNDRSHFFSSLGYVWVRDAVQSSSPFLSLVITFNLPLFMRRSPTDRINANASTNLGYWHIRCSNWITYIYFVLLSLLGINGLGGLPLFTALCLGWNKSASATTVFLSLLSQWSILTLLTLQITRQLRKAGESTSMLCLRK